MITAVYNRQNNNVERALPLSPIDVRIEGESNPADITAFLVSLAESVKVVETVPQIGVQIVGRDIQNNPYYLNKYGDDYACCDDLGFERSYMGSRADHNHII
ncbi:MAG: hypothetical protein IKW89_03940 [Bacteroidales bacterium]|nr:hypothetical protein [Bacteroidales bacterium]